MQNFQFSLKRLIYVVTAAAVVVGGYFALGRAKGNARIEGVRQAIREGRIDGEEYREWFSAEEFEQLRKEAGR
jgi:hypothetical protein